MEHSKVILFKSGQIYDIDKGKFISADFTVDSGLIKEIGRLETASGLRVIDLKNRFVVPGLIDMHVHLREPGREDEETIESGCTAALAGGFTAVCCMPNTNPPLDHRSHIEFVRKQARDLPVSVHPIGAVTKGRAGVELTEMGDMLDAGAVAFSDDGDTVATSEILRYALEYSKRFKVPIIDHCEDPSLVRGKVMNEGLVSTSLGLPGAPTVAEDLIVARDIMMAEFTGGHVHIAHISSGNSVEFVRRAKERGVHVTAEVCPHHFILKDEAVRDFDSNLRVNPPVRTARDIEMIIEGLADGTIDAIVTDHAPHSIEEKDVEFQAAPPGMVGLETVVGLVLTHLVKANRLSLEQVVEKMAVVPRRLLNLSVPAIRSGAEANFSVLDPKTSWKVDKTLFKSKSRNTPFDGWELQGKAVGVYSRGRWFTSETPETNSK